MVKILVRGCNVTSRSWVFRIIDTNTVSYRILKWPLFVKQPPQQEPPPLAEVEVVADAIAYGIGVLSLRSWISSLVFL